MTSRSRGSVLARAAAISLAASRSSRNFGSGSGFFGMSPAMTGLRDGASGQSHSMIRSKNAWTVRIRCRCVPAVITWPAAWGWMVSPDSRHGVPPRRPSRAACRKVPG